MKLPTIVNRAQGCVCVCSCCILIYFVYTRDAVRYDIGEKIRRKECPTRSGERGRQREEDDAGIK